MLAAGFLVIWLASLPAYYERARTLTIEPVEQSGQIVLDNQTFIQDAVQRGMTVQTSVIFELTFNAVQIGCYYLVAGIVLWRAKNRFGVFTAFVLMLLPVVSMHHVVRVASLFPKAFILIEIVNFLIWPTWYLWIALFPNGRLVPFRAFILILPTIAVFIVIQLISLLAVVEILPTEMLYLNISSDIGPLIVLPLLGVILYSQIYRYRRIFTLVERQQTKWFLFGLGMFFTMIGIFGLTPNAIRDDVLVQDLFSGLFLFYPIVVAITVLRYRLFEIDLIIRRTLQYSLLSVLLAAVYFGSIISLQNLIGRDQSEFVIVLSTLAIAALFNPLRRRVQDFIDRRFYRKKYIAEQALASFAAAARDEVELDRLSSALIGVVQQTVQPETVRLWLKTKAVGQPATEAFTFPKVLDP